MIESQANPNLQPPQAPTTTGSQIKASTFPASPPPSPGNNKRTIYIVMGLLLFVAIAGGVLLFRNLSKSSDMSLTETEQTFAWKPSSVTGTCTGGRVIGNNESVAYDFEFTFILSNGDRSAVLRHTFKSKPAGNKFKIDEDFQWSDFGTEGVEFASKLRTGDKINWKATAVYTMNNQERREDYSDFFMNNDTTCTGTTASSSPVATASTTPTATATASPSATVRAQATASPSATVRASATPTGSPGIGGTDETPTPVPTATATPAPAKTATPAPTAAPTAVTEALQNEVADATTLPKAGIENGMWFILIGFVSFVLSLFFALKKKKYY